MHILAVFRTLRGAQFDEFIADFIKDEAENWWMINVKGFILTDKMNIRPKEFFASPEELEEVNKTKVIVKLFCHFLIRKEKTRFQWKNKFLQIL